MRHSHIDRPVDRKPIAIDVEGEPQGIVVPEDEGFRFVAVRFDAFAIDGRRFASVDAARRAARSAVASGETH